VNPPLSIPSTNPKYSLSPALRLAILAAVFFLEKLLLDSFVDSERAQAAQGLGGAVRLIQHWGFRFLIAFCGALTVFAWVRGGVRLASVGESMRSANTRVIWILVHILLLACLVPLSYNLYRDTDALPFSVLFVAWMVLGIGAGLSAALAMANWSIWLRAARALGIIWCYAAIAALFSVSAMQLSQGLWAPTTAVTFELVRRVLMLIIPTLSVDPANRILSTDHFAVQVTEYCSGLEGMGLILAFMVPWLLYFRREYIFPRALLLIPLGLLTMFALNVFRLAALMLIGHLGFPEVAGYGFHSQAGWIAFNLAACGLVFFSRRSAWLNREASKSSDSAATENPTAAYLIPLLALLAAGQLSQAMSGQFESFYPLRLVAGLSALLIYRERLAKLNWSFTARGPAVGILVFLIWVWAAHFLVSAEGMPAQLAALSPAMRALWVATRVATSTLVIPVAEELAYRGYLMRRLVSEDFESVPFHKVRWPAVLLTALVFGLAHGAFWLPGIAAGLAFGFILVRRNSIGEAVAAHVTGNALVTVSVIGLNQWQLW
jgi:exosortase E/protease (VPEID-CTERM system)